MIKFCGNSDLIMDVVIILNLYTEDLSSKVRFSFSCQVMFPAG